MKIDLNRNEPLIVDNTPQGSNKLTSRASFMQKKSYELNAYQGVDVLRNKTMDLWYDKMLYGRIDKFNSSILLKKDTLKQVNQTDDTVLAVDFVVEAFHDFVDHWRTLVKKNIVTPDSLYFSMHLKKGWEDANANYGDILNIYYKQLLEFLKGNNNNLKVLDFKSFLKVFVTFQDQQTPYAPILRSSVHVSRFNNPNTSGLVLDLKDIDCSDDTLKTQYINDSHYSLFRETAKKFGFVLDKHAPWKLFADLSSEQMKPYLERHNVSFETVFDKYYDNLRYPDLDLLKIYIIQMYNAYVSLKPTIVKPHFKICNGRVKLRIEETKRSPSSLKILELQVPDSVWLRLYVFLKARENNLKWTQVYFEQIVQKTVEFKNALDFPAAIDYANDRTKAPAISSKRKEREFHF